MSLEITCPSGLCGVLRGMRVKDEELFADRKLAQSGRVLSKLIESCWEQTLHAGPYSGENVVWGSALMADRTFLIIQIRIVSYGPEYTFQVECANCETKFDHTVQLDQLSVSAVSDAGKACVRSGEPAKLTLKGGQEVLCRPLTGDDEEFFAGLPKNERAQILTYQLARKIVRIGEATHWHDVLEAVENLPAAVADDLWDQTDALEGGVDTSIPVACPRCGAEPFVILPFEAGFFSSRKRFSRSRQPSPGSRR